MEPDALRAEVRGRFPPGAVGEVEVLAYGDDPAIEPGALGIRVHLPEGTDTAEDRPLERFHDQHRDAIHQLGKDLSRIAGRPTKLEITGGNNTIFMLGIDAPLERENLTPVMARLAPPDLETLDTLIGAGFATSRAEAVRWALARVRERPAFQQLRRHIREIGELKSSF